MMLQDIRESYITKFDTPITAFIYDRVIMNGFADDSIGFENGDWYSRVGRRIVGGDDQGFVYSYKLETVEEALDEMLQIENEIEEEGDAYADDGGQAIGQYDE